MATKFVNTYSIDTAADVLNNNLFTWLYLYGQQTQPTDLNDRVRPILDNALKQSNPAQREPANQSEPQRLEVERRAAVVAGDKFAAAQILRSLDVDPETLRGAAQNTVVRPSIPQ